MKLWIAMFLVLVVIIAGGLYLESAILKTTDQISRTLTSVKAAVRNDQWSEALASVNAIDERWSRCKDVWSPFIHNHDLDTVTLHLARLKAFLETHDKGSALAEITNIEIQLLQVRQQEVLSLQNVL
ncbi:MAG: DUF4363 family protein [Firmicutes bacterium]|nr:DUF4363 family protein [Bacillota bacterium]